MADHINVLIFILHKFSINALLCLRYVVLTTTKCIRYESDVCIEQIRALKALNIDTHAHAHRSIFKWPL